MRRRPILIGVGTLALAVAVAVTSIVVGKSTKKSSISQNQQKVSKPDHPGTINGNDNPGLIPDHVAYTLVLRTIATRQRTDFEKARSRAWAKSIGLNDAAGDKLIEVANEFEARVRALDQQAKEIKDRTWPNPGDGTIAQLTTLQRKKEALVAEVTASLPVRLGQETAAKLHQHTTDHLKRKMKIAPVSANPLGKHH